jgi:hypothetical protein
LRFLRSTIGTMASRMPSVPPRPLAPGDVVAAFCESLGEWSAGQITDLDQGWQKAGVLDLDWSGPEPASVTDLSRPAALRLTHHSWAGKIPVALTGERHRRRQHLVPPGEVIAPQPGSADRRPAPGRRASRRRQRYPGWRVAAPPPPGRIPERAKPVRPADAAGPVTADPHARIVHSSGEPVRPLSRKADAPGPPAQQPGGTIDLRTRDAPPYRCGQLRPAPHRGPPGGSVISAA